MPAMTLLADDELSPTSVCDSARRHLEVDAPRAQRSLCIAVIGSGNACSNVALAMLQALHRVIVYDAAEHDAASLGREGARVASSVKDACCSADLVFTTLASDDAMEAIVLGPGGVAQSLPLNAIHISLGSMSVGCTDRIVEAHWDAGQRYISAPVIGSPDEAAIGQLRMVAAGREEVFKEVEPILDAAGHVAARVYGWPSLANALRQELVLEAVI